MCFSLEMHHGWFTFLLMLKQLSIVTPKFTEVLECIFLPKVILRIHSFASEHLVMLRAILDQLNTRTTERTMI